MTLRNSTLSNSRTEDGLDLDTTANGNTLTLVGSSFSNNASDGISIGSDNNLINIFQVELQGNGDYGLNIAGDNNIISLGNSSFTGNTDGAILIGGNNNTIRISNSMLDINDVLNTGTGNTILFV